MKTLIYTFLLLFLNFQIYGQSGLSISITNATVSVDGLTWTFDIECNSTASYVSPDNNWNAMNIGFNILLPVGITIVSGSGTSNTTYIEALPGFASSIQGAPPVGWREFGVTMLRSGADIPSVPVRLATYTITFSQALVGLTSANGVEMRAPATDTGSFWSNLSDPENQRSFNIPSFTPLPIHLSQFSATKHAERTSLLNWKTSSEINSDYFDIERSQDGNTWETIGRVTAAGNSSSELTYAFIDDKLPLIRSKEQLFYYRLRMTDLDGTFKYSDIRGVNFGKLSEGVVSIYPNPTVEHINVDLSGMDLEAGNVDLFVYDMTGRQMIKKSIIGNGIELIDVTLLPASTYNVVVKQGATTYQQRVIKID